MLVAASPAPPPESQDYGAAFYDQFKTYYLPPLDLGEMRELLAALAKSAGRDDVATRVRQNPGRIAALHQLTGGNPRTTVLCFISMRRISPPPCSATWSSFSTA